MDISYNEYDSEECSGEDMLVDPDEDVATQVTNKIMIEKLRSVLPLLSVTVMLTSDVPLCIMIPDVIVAPVNVTPCTTVL